MGNVTGGGSTQPTKTWAQVANPKITPPETGTPPPKTDSTPKTTGSSGVSTPPKPSPKSEIGTDTQIKQTEQTIQTVSSGSMVSKSGGIPKPGGLSKVQPPKLTYPNFKGLLDGGRISHAELMKLVPKGTEDIFVPSRRLPDGEKYQFSVGKNNYEVKFHCADPFGGPNSSSGWTAQITVNGKLMTQRGGFRFGPNNSTHIPLDN